LSTFEKKMYRQFLKSGHKRLQLSNFPFSGGHAALRVECDRGVLPPCTASQNISTQLTSQLPLTDTAFSQEGALGAPSPENYCRGPASRLEVKCGRRTAVERGGNNLNVFNDFRTENGSSQGQNLALTGLFVPSSLTPHILPSRRFFLCDFWHETAGSQPV